MNQPENEQVDLVAGNYYPKYSTKNFVARYLTRNFISTLLDVIGRVEARTCLDVGSGEGFLLQQVRLRFPALHIISSDISHTMQLLSTQTTFLPGMVAAAERLPCADNAVDLVVACEVLEHLHEPEQALAEIQRVTRKFCILSVPREPLWRAMNVARLAYLQQLGNTPGHLQHWSRREFVGLVKKYFEVLEIKNPVPWTFIAGRK